MNVAGTLWVPRDLAGAARTIADGKVLAMDMGRSGNRFFLEAAGIGLDGGLFGYFERLESGARLFGTLRAAVRFVRQRGNPRVTLEYDDTRLETRAPMVSVANGPYVGAAYAIGPDARIDDGLLDVVVFRHTSIFRVLLHLVLIAGGRPLPPPSQARTLRVASLRVDKRRGRPLPVHADGEPLGVTRALRGRSCGIARHRRSAGVHRHLRLGSCRASGPHLSNLAPSNPGSPALTEETMERQSPETGIPGAIPIEGT
jgi:diacylglycerol kinase family enzyme